MGRKLAAAALATFALSAAVAGKGADLSVDIKNETAMAVSVPAGTDNGVTRDSDFEIPLPGGGAARIYPAELFSGRFWSQPLPLEVFEAVKPGTPVRPVALDAVEHAKLRAEGRARAEELKARAEQARRAVLRRKLEDLRGERDRLVERRDDLDERIAAAERDLSEEEGRTEWVTTSADDDIDRALQRIAEMADRRDELQSQREVLSRQNPYPRGEIDRLSSEIRSLNARIDSERAAVRIGRERKRSARAAYLAKKQEREKLLSERSAVVVEIRRVEQKIREIASELGGR